MTRHYSSEPYGSNTSYFLFDDPRFTSLLKYRGANYSTNIGVVLKALEEWRNRYNISVVKECEHSEYCSGQFRDLILAYNSIHGYISLLVCFRLLHFKVIVISYIAQFSDDLSIERRWSRVCFSWTICFKNFANW